MWCWYHSSQHLTKTSILASNIFSPLAYGPLRWQGKLLAAKFIYANEPCTNHSYQTHTPTPSLKKPPHDIIQADWDIPTALHATVTSSTERNPHPHRGSEIETFGELFIDFFVEGIGIYVFGEGSGR